MLQGEGVGWGTGVLRGTRSSGRIITTQGCVLALGHGTGPHTPSGLDHTSVSALTLVILVGDQSVHTHVHLLFMTDSKQIRTSPFHGGAPVTQPSLSSPIHFPRISLRSTPGPRALCCWTLQCSSTKRHSCVANELTAFAKTAVSWVGYDTDVLSWSM